MLNPNMEELAQIDNETLEVILKNDPLTDRNDETSPTSRMCCLLCTLMILSNVSAVYVKQSVRSILQM